MQPTKKLTVVLRDLVALLDDESARNPEFAARLDVVLAGLPDQRGKSRRSQKSLKLGADVLDVFAALQKQGETEFRFWLRSLDVPTLKAVIKANGFDPAKTSHRWAEPDKFVALVADQTAARLKRGYAFLPPKADT